MLCLVTGATGFLGSSVARVLAEAGHRVRVLARPASDRRNLAGLAVEIATGSLDDHASLAPAVEGCDALFHVAADYRLWVPDPDAMYRTNVEGTRALMLATPVTLDDMIGPYKRSKFMSEAVVRDLVRDRGLPAVIVNPSTPIGPRDLKPTPTGRLIVEAASGRMPAFVDTGLNWAHVDDVAAGHLQAFERGAVGERYILGGENLSLREVLRIIAGIVGRKPPTVELPAGAILPLAYAAEFVSRFTHKEPFVTVDGVKLARKTMFFAIDKARRDLGYAPRPAEAGFRDAIAWFRANGYLAGRS
jgi:dihydroflavonol-4-reductase